jgi:hypothetical protein
MAKESAGNVYRDILAWGIALPRWQQELLRRVLPERDLTQADIEELAAAATAEVEQQPSPYPGLSLQDVPAVAEPTDPRRLRAITGVKGVNALRSDQSLSFGPQMTVVYGDNGSGKSGYARVLKRVYRARVVEDILGNLTVEKYAPEPCAATFVLVEPNNDETQIPWIDGSGTVSVGRFAVLDTACAGTYIRGGALAVGPAGIDVPRRFT